MGINTVGFNRRQAFAFFGIVTCSRSSLVAAAGIASSAERSAERENLRLRLVLELHNSFGVDLGAQRLCSLVPAEYSSQQGLLAVNCSQSFRLEHDPIGNNIGIIELPHLLAWQRITIGLSFDVWLDRNGSENMDPRDRAQWLLPERHVESSAPEMIALAKHMTGSAATLTARNIYDWVVENVRYAGYVPEDLGALYALRNRCGDCTEFAALTVALARACGIPSRVIGGYVVSGSTQIKFPQYHNWAELWLDGCWCVVDAQRGCFGVCSEIYCRFHVYGTGDNEGKWPHKYKIDGGAQVYG